MSHETLQELLRLRFGVESATEPEAAVPEPLVGILRRRTHRRFTDEPVPEELLETLFACALSAPSKSDLQQASVVRVKDAAKRETVASLIPNMPWIGTSSEFLVFCADHRRIRRVAEMRGHDFANDNLDGFVNATVDAALVLQTFLLAAESVGLGCCPISVIRDHIEKVTELLELPPCVYPVAGLCVGVPAHDGHVSLRLPPAVTVHTDRYDDENLAAEIDAYDRRCDAVFSIPREKQRYAELFGEADFYSWSEDKARQESQPEREGFRRFLQEHGFSLE